MCSNNIDFSLQPKASQGPLNLVDNGQVQTGFSQQEMVARQNNLLVTAINNVLCIVEKCHCYTWNI
ncbi:hypothetical protein EON64_12950 [archaeon]|nr:MAG: hypothetical protein EON64_12950 [archaeon]